MAEEPARVLLLDDYLDVLEAYEEWFRLEGWLPLRARTEIEALQALTTWRPRAVVVEPYLSSGDGIASLGLREPCSDPAFV